jgi:hypothetical protein
VAMGEERTPLPKRAAQVNSVNRVTVYTTRRG